MLQWLVRLLISTLLPVDRFRFGATDLGRAADLAPASTSRNGAEPEPR